MKFVSNNLNQLVLEKKWKRTFSTRQFPIKYTGFLNEQMHTCLGKKWIFFNFNFGPTLFL